MSSIETSLLALIKQVNPLAAPLTEQDITFSNPTPNSGVSAEGVSWNTKMTVSSVANTGYFGDVDVFFTRLDVDELYGALELLSELEPTSDEFLAFLNQNPSLTVAFPDLQTIAIPSLNVGDIGSISVTADVNSLGVIGTTKIGILVGLPPNVSLLHILVNQTFPTNNYLIPNV